MLKARAAQVLSASYSSSTANSSASTPMISPLQSRRHSRTDSFFLPDVPDSVATSTKNEPDTMVPDTQQPLPSDGKDGTATRHVPVPKIPDPMPKELEFMFRKYSNDEVAFCWRVYLVVFLFQVLWCWLYGFAVGHPEFISFRT